MRVLRIGDVVHMTSLSRMTIYRLEHVGEFPARRQLSKNSVAWLEEEVAEWLRTRPTLNSTQSDGVRHVPDRRARSGTI